MSSHAENMVHLERVVAGLLTYTLTMVSLAPFIGPNSATSSGWVWWEEWEGSAGTIALFPTNTCQET